MSITPNEAADALRSIEQTGRRSGEAFGYRQSAPHLIIWGIAWMIGYGGSDLFPAYGNDIWLGTVIAGTAASLITGTMMSKSDRGEGWRFGVLVLIFWAFLIATDLVFGGPTARQQGAFIPLVIAAIYAGIGVFMGFRYVATGIAVAALTLIGFFYIHEHFGLWMAAVGGGGLLLAGLWLRTA
jgi:hypothetical protein